MMFELSGVSVTAGPRTLLHGIDLSLDGTGLVGLIGHNGSGKSTLLRVLARQLAPSTGHVRFGGRRLQDWGMREFARQLAYLPQEPPATTGMTVRDLVGLGRYAWHGALGRFGTDDRVAVEAAMERTGMARFAGRAVAELSGGERQCCWIAMSLAQEARCLLLDEPTAALDLAHQRVVLDVLRSLNREHGIGIVIVLHDINLAARYCDELVALRTGRLIARGAAADIMTTERLREIYAVDLGLLPHPSGGAPIAYLP
ncbi:MAG: ABC transporter ATP-binding protein [Janthinobacterium lividum]